jgi:hypothetical protein
MIMSEVTRTSPAKADAFLWLTRTSPAKGPTSLDKAVSDRLTWTSPDRARTSMTKATGLIWITQTSLDRWSD